MITLRDAIEIKASPEQIIDFFLNFKDNFYVWHPDHVECRYLTPGPLKENSVIYFEEYLHGKLHKLKLRITLIKPNSRIEYKTFMGTKGVFVMEPRDTMTLFIAEMHMGSNMPVLGKIMDRIMLKFLSRQLEGLRQHMVEEGHNLKKILEQSIS
jgi:hypothetical protein